MAQQLLLYTDVFAAVLLLRGVDDCVLRPEACLDVRMIDT